MKAPKISLDTAKLQQLLLMHVEKIVLGVVVLAVIWFVYQGASLKGLDPTKTPNKLSQDSVLVTTEINNPNHKGPIVDVRDPKHPVQLLVKQGQESNDSIAYRLPNPWKTPDYPKAQFRTDPRPFPPEHVIATAYYGPLAMIANAEDLDPILSVELDEPTEGGIRQPGGIVRPQPQPQPGGPRRPGAEGRPPGPTRPRTGRQGAGLLEGGPEGYPAMQPPAYGQGMMTPGAPGSRQLPPEAMVGIRSAGTGIICKEGRAVVVLAAVPMEKQLEEFEKAFKDALDYDESRDIPRYVLFLVERADVTDDPAIDPLQATWTPLGVNGITRALKEMDTWAPSPNEVVDINAIDPLILTHRAPPFLQRDIYDALVHPDIPKAKLVGADGVPGAEGQRRPGEAAPGDATSEEDLTGAAQNPSGAAGGPIEGPRTQRPPAMRQPGYGAPPGYGARPGYGQPPGGRGMQPGAFRGGYGEGGVGGSPQDLKLAKYKLLRFTDTTVEPLRKYRYRVKLLLEDPNNPYAGTTPPRWDPGRTTPLRKPSIQSMSPNVLQRVRTADAAVATTKKQAYLLESDPSEPSAIVELPPANHYFAGKATPGGGSSFPATAERPQTPVVFTAQPSANLLTVEWDKEKAVDVAAEKEVFRGSTLNFEKEVDVIHPALLAIHPIGKYTFKNNSIVLDFAGGNEIPSLEKRSDTKVQEPCEVLIIDGLGNLQLLNETDDVDGFRRYLPPKAEEVKATTPGVFGLEGGQPGGLLDAPRGPPRAGPGPGRGKGG